MLARGRYRVTKGPFSPFPHLSPPFKSTAGKVLPFRVDAVRFETSLSWNVAPGSRAVDRRAALSVRGADLGLPAAVLPYVRAIAGPHYNPHSDLLRISVEKYKDAALNKRAALEKLLSLVEASIGMHGKFGPMKAERRFPAYRNH